MLIWVWQDKLMSRHYEASMMPFLAEDHILWLPDLAVTPE